MAHTQSEDLVADTDPKRSKILAMERLKAKNARLRLMKERNENYLAEREVDEDLELRVLTTD
jgi:hypothetical protein